MTFTKKYFITIIILTLFLIPSFSTGELNNFENRPFWTSKTNYVEFGVVYGVGTAISKKKLEKGREESFKNGILEIANYAQITNTSLLFVETQMTYEEQNKDGSYSVWRLVKVPFEMIKNVKKALTSTSPIYGKIAKKVKELEKQNENDKALNLKKMVSMGKSVGDLKSQMKILNKRMKKVENKIIFMKTFLALKGNWNEKWPRYSKFHTYR